jgi:hypothetical protein
VVAGAGAVAVFKYLVPGVEDLLSWLDLIYGLRCGRGRARGRATAGLRRPAAACHGGGGERARCRGQLAALRWAPCSLAAPRSAAPLCGAGAAAGRAPGACADAPLPSTCRSFIKLAISLFKYTPQVWLNYRRRCAAQRCAAAPLRWLPSRARRPGDHLSAPASQGHPPSQLLGRPLLAANRRASGHGWERGGG